MEPRRDLEPPRGSQAGAKRRRPPRSAASRRAQAVRAEGRAVSRLLRAFHELRAHRGCQLTKLASALREALSSDYPSRDGPGASADVPADAQAVRAPACSGVDPSAYTQPQALVIPAAVAADESDVDGFDLGASRRRPRAPTPPVKRSRRSSPVTCRQANVEASPVSLPADAPPAGATSLAADSPLVAQVDIGSQVRVVGLLAQPQLNGRVGCVIDRDDERYRIRLDAVPGVILPGVDIEPSRVVRVRHVNVALETPDG